MIPDVDFKRIGQRIKTKRQEKNFSQAELGALVGHSNNHISHIETAQTKASLSMLLGLSYALETPLDYFLLDTPFAQAETIINQDIAKKLSQCEPATLNAVSRMIDVLLEQQRAFQEKND